MSTPVHTLEPSWPHHKSYYDGLYIGIDGLDGSGRSTLALSLQTLLQSEGYPAVVVTPFPNLKMQKFIAEVKHDRRLEMKSRHLLYASLFAIVTEHMILPHLTAGYVVLSDRSWISLYARAVAQGLNDQWVRTTLGFALIPDIVLEPQADPLSAARRKLMVTDALDPLESVSDRERLDGFIAFQRRVRDILDHVKAMVPWHTLDLGDGSNSLQAILPLLIAKMEGREVSS
ncbi:dTMP kinase [Sulfobacillus thermosulfidooxidans]|uniref:dTMP kinase n=1 Tax=Sulfobacillus thermosulfidooxidans TaxID=28034 RepID=UPI0004128828|nr:hypothetical protein [Sulfobacillus thermosulfidooxidans]